MKPKSHINIVLTIITWLFSMNSFSQNVGSYSTRIEVVDTIAKQSQVQENIGQNNVEVKINSDSIPKAHETPKKKIRYKYVARTSDTDTVKLPDGRYYYPLKKINKFKGVGLVVLGSAMTVGVPLALGFAYSGAIVAPAIGSSLIGECAAFHFASCALYGPIYVLPAGVKELSKNKPKVVNQKMTRSQKKARIPIVKVKTVVPGRGFQVMLESTAGAPMGRNPSSVMNFNVITGYRFNPKISVGVGAGITQFSNLIGYGNTTGLPLFVNVVYNMRDAKVSPFLSCNMGNLFALNNNLKPYGATMSFTGGLSFKNAKSMLNIGLTFSNTEGTTNKPLIGNQTNPFSQAVGLTAGYTF